MALPAGQILLLRHAWRCGHFCTSPMRAAGAEDDGKASALERVVEALRAQDEAALTDRGDRAAKERTRGAAVRNQKALWERMLEMRILLQRCLQVSAEP